MDSQSPKKKHPKRKCLQTKRHGFSILLAVFLGIIIFFTAPAEAAASLYSSNPGTMSIEQLTIKDWNGNSLAIGQEEDFALSISGILAKLEAGEVGASQAALFASAQDEQQGIIKNTVDVAADSINSTIDLVIVLDTSGSMAKALPTSDLLPDEATRFAVAKQAILQLSESVLREDRHNRISVVSFSAGVDGALTFTSDLEAVNGFVSGLSTGSDTNYESGLNQAEAFLNGRPEAERERKSYVVLITDGQPNRGDALAGANRLKSNTNAEFYCVGIQSGASDLLSVLATDDSHFKDCATTDDFMQYMTQLNWKVPTAQSAIIWTEIGSSFTLFCSEAYPISIGKDVYFSTDDIPSGLMLFTAEQNQVQWNMPAITRSGVRINYYTLLTNQARVDLNNHAMIPVSDTGSLEYYLQYKDVDGTIKTADSPTSTALPLYSISAQSSVLTVSIFSDKMKTGDALIGKALQYADTIQYTVQVENVGQLTAEDIMIGANIPDGTEYVSGTGAVPDYDKQIVSSEPLTLLPGTVQEISFIVRVRIREGVIANTGFWRPMLRGFTLEQITTRELTNPVTPPLSIESPVIFPPENVGTGSLVFTVKMVDTAEDIPFFVVVELSDDINGRYGDVVFVNGKAEFVIRHGETKIAWDLPAGVAYIARISAHLPCAFQVGEKDPSVAAGKIGTDTIIEVAFHAYYAGAEKEKEKPEEAEITDSIPPIDGENIEIEDAEMPETNNDAPSDCEDAGKEGEVETGTNSIVPEEPSASQTAQDKDSDVDVAHKSYMWLLLVIAVLCIVLTIQMISIRSDLRVLRWYRLKKAKFSDKDKGSKYTD